VANDTDDDDDDLNVSQIFNDTAQGGLVQLTAFDTFTYTPKAGFVGTDTVTYTISDGFGGFVTTTLDIEVVNSAPVAVADPVITIRPGQQAVFTGASLVANDTDGDDDDLNVSQIFNDTAQGGLVQLTAFDTFTYTISDGFGGFVTTTLDIEVEEDGFDFNLIAAAPNQRFLRGTDEADALVFNTSRSTQAFGGDGADVFVFLKSGDGKRDTGYIRDFDQGVDLIDVGDAAFTMRVVGNNTVIRFSTPDRDSLIVSDVVLTAADFTTEWSSRDDGLLA
jgi:hypothetical protein